MPSEPLLLAETRLLGRTSKSSIEFVVIKVKQILPENPHCPKMTVTLCYYEGYNSLGGNAPRRSREEGDLANARSGRWMLPRQGYAGQGSGRAGFMLDFGIETYHR